MKHFKDGPRFQTYKTKGGMGDAPWESASAERLAKTDAAWAAASASDPPKPQDDDGHMRVLIASSCKRGVFTGRLGNPEEDRFRVSTKFAGERKVLFEGFFADAIAFVDALPLSIKKDDADASQ